MNKKWLWWDVIYGDFEIKKNLWWSPLTLLLCLCIYILSPLGSWGKVLWSLLSMVHLSTKIYCYCLMASALILWNYTINSVYWCELIAFFSGTPDERGLGWRTDNDASDGILRDTLAQYDIPLVTNLLRRTRWASYIPISPTFQAKHFSICCRSKTSTYEVAVDVSDSAIPIELGDRPRDRDQESNK